MYSATALRRARDNRDNTMSLASLVREVGVVRVRSIDVEVDGLSIFLLASLVVVMVAAVLRLLVRCSRHGIRLQPELIDPELDLVANVRVVGGAAEDWTHV